MGLVEGRAWSELKLPDQVRLMREAWAAPTPRLLIFDNCEDAALLETSRPTSGGCRILITSRQDVWPASMGVLALPLTVLPRVESLALLGKHRADLAEHPALDALAAEVGDLPLALHLAGSYSKPIQVVKRSRAFRRFYSAKASTPRDNLNRIAIFGDLP